MLGDGKCADILYNWTSDYRYVLFDIVRKKEDRVNYEIMERLRNGMFFSGKYHTEMKAGDVNVVVFANFVPDYDAFSEDRPKVWRIHENQMIAMSLDEVKSESDDLEIERMAEQLRKKKRAYERAFPDKVYDENNQTINNYNISMPKIMCNVLTKVIQQHAKVHYNHPDQSIIGNNGQLINLKRQRKEYDY